VLLVHVRADDTEGWGECVTASAPIHSYEYTDGAARVLEHHLVPALIADGTRVTAGQVHRRLATVKGHPLARAALEAAVLDAELRADGTSLADHLGGVRDRVPAGVSVGIPEGGTGDLLDQVAGYVAEGYLRIKLKIEPGTDLEPVSAVREGFGPELPLQVDANAAYDPDDPAHLAVLDGLDRLHLEQIEQPFAANRVRDQARLAARWRTPLCLDESIGDALDARDAVETGACAIVNVKVGRVGGVSEAVRVHEVCRERAVPVWCGGMLETGVGRAVNVAVASLPGFTLPGDTSASDRYWAEDVTDPFVLDDGHLEVPTGPGIGRSPRPEALATARRKTIHGPGPRR